MLPVATAAQLYVCTSERVSPVEGNSERKDSSGTSWIFRVTRNDAPTFQREAPIIGSTTSRIADKQRDISANLLKSPPLREEVSRVARVANYRRNCSSSELHSRRREFDDRRFGAWRSGEESSSRTSTFRVIHREVEHSTRGRLRAAPWLLPSRPTAKRGLRAWIAAARPFISAAAGRLSLSFVSLLPFLSISRVQTFLSLSLSRLSLRSTSVRGERRATEGSRNGMHRTNWCVHTSAILHDARLALVLISHANVNCKKALTSLVATTVQVN